LITTIFFISGRVIIGLILCLADRPMDVDFTAATLTTPHAFVHLNDWLVDDCLFDHWS